MSAETFRCITCDKSMNTRKAFNRHLNTHSKPHRCKSCLSGFALASDLVRHVKALHRVGNVQYRCHIESCTFTSNRKDNLKKHKKKYHKGALLTAKGDDAMANNTTTSSLEQLGSPTAATDDSNSLYGISILMQAATSGDLTTLELLLDAGVLLETRADDQSTALHCAARAGQSKAVQYLLEKGAEMNVKNTERRLPVHEALLSSDLETMRIFLRRTTNQQLLDATQKFRYYLGRSNRVETLELYSELLGADFTAYERISIFRYAVCAGSERIVAALKDHPDIDLNQIFFNAYAPIHYAAMFGRERVMKILLASEQVNKDVTTRRGDMLALHIAALNGKSNVLQLLIRHGSSNVSRRDRFGVSPLQHAAFHGHWRSVLILLEHLSVSDEKDSTAALPAPSVFVKIDVIRKLLDHAEFEDPNRHGPGWHRRNLLHRASEKGDCELMEILLAHNKVNVNAKDISQDSALILAAMNGHFEAVRLLLQRSDIDMNQKSWRGTALKVARGRGNQEIVDLLLSHGAIDDGTSEPSIATRINNASAADDPSDTQNIALPLEYEPDPNFDLDGFMNRVPDWDDFQEVEDGMFE